MQKTCLLCAVRRELKNAFGRGKGDRFCFSNLAAEKKLQDIVGAHRKIKNENVNFAL